jgi:hypothetical protein
VLFAPGSSQHEPEWGGIRTAAVLGAARLDVGDAVLPAMVDDDAPAGDDDVAIPVHILAVRELGDESLGYLDKDHRCLGLAVVGYFWSASKFNHDPT